MQFLLKLITGKETQESDLQERHQDLCNYADNYYGDQVCLQKSTD